MMVPVCLPFSVTGTSSAASGNASLAIAVGR